MVLTLTSLIVPYIPGVNSGLGIIYVLFVMSIAFTISHILNLSERYWMLPGIVLIGLLLNGFLDGSIILLIQYLILFIISSLYTTQVIHANENQAVIYLLVLLVSGLVGLFLHVWYVLWIVIGPLAEYYGSKTVIVTRTYSDMLVIKLLILLSLGLPLRLVLIPLATTLIYPWIKENILSFSIDTGVRLLYTISIQIFQGV